MKMHFANASRILLLLVMITGSSYFRNDFFGFFEKDYYSLTNQNDFGLIDQAKQWCYNRNLDTYEKTRDW
jgi:hypothetical protein